MSLEKGNLSTSLSHLVTRSPSSTCLQIPLSDPPISWRLDKPLYPVVPVFSQINNYFDMQFGAWSILYNRMVKEQGARHQSAKENSLFIWTNKHAVFSLAVYQTKNRRVNKGCLFILSLNKARRLWKKIINRGGWSWCSPSAEQDDTCIACLPYLGCKQTMSGGTFLVPEWGLPLSEWVWKGVREKRSWERVQV